MGHRTKEPLGARSFSNRPFALPFSHSHAASQPTAALGKSEVGRHRHRHRHTRQDRQDSLVSIVQAANITHPIPCPLPLSHPSPQSWKWTRIPSCQPDSPSSPFRLPGPGPGPGSEPNKINPPTPGPQRHTHRESRYQPRHPAIRAPLPSSIAESFQDAPPPNDFTAPGPGGGPPREKKKCDQGRPGCGLLAGPPALGQLATPNCPRFNSIGKPTCFFSFQVLRRGITNSTHTQLLGLPTS